MLGKIFFFTPFHCLCSLWLFLITEKEGTQFHRINVNKKTILIRKKSDTFDIYDLANHSSQIWIMSWLTSTKKSLLTSVCLFEEPGELDTQDSSK